MKTVDEDPYAVLRVPRDASMEEIEAQYKFLAEGFHPDRFKGEKKKALAEDHFKRLGSARDELKRRHDAGTLGQLDHDGSDSGESSLDDDVPEPDPFYTESQASPYEYQPPSCEPSFHYERPEPGNYAPPSRPSPKRRRRRGRVFLVLLVLLVLVGGGVVTALGKANDWGRVPKSPAAVQLSGPVRNSERGDQPFFNIRVAGATTGERVDQGPLREIIPPSPFRRIPSDQVIVAVHFDSETWLVEQSKGLQELRVQAQNVNYTSGSHTIQVELLSIDGRHFKPPILSNPISFVFESRP